MWYLIVSIPDIFTITYSDLEVIKMLIKTKIKTNEEVSCFKSLKCCIYHDNNVKMPTIVGILTFMSRINFVLS